MTKQKKRIRILLADDHALVRGGIRALLKAQHEWSVVGEAANGREAVQKAQRLQPDIVILDVTMPELDGLDATRQIRETVPNSRIVILTMHESSQMVRRVLEAGAQGYVLKSDISSHLVKAVNKVLRGQYSLTPKVSEIVLSEFIKPEVESPRVESDKARPTPREMQVIRLLAKGKSNKETALALGITVRTVETHRAKIMLKLNLHSLIEIVRYAAIYGMTENTT